MSASKAEIRDAIILPAALFLAERPVRIFIGSRRTDLVETSGELKRQITQQQRKAAQLAKQSSRAAAGEPVFAKESARFHARGFRSLRKRLGLSAPKMAALLGVSALSIYNWESGKIAPQRKSLAAIVDLRGFGKREV